MAEERISELKIGQWKLPKLKSKEKKILGEKQKWIAKSCGHLQKCVIYAQCKNQRRRKKKTEAIFEAMITENFLQINVTHKTIESSRTTN